MFFFQAEDGIRDLVRSRGLGDVYKRQGKNYKLQQNWWFDQRRDIVASTSAALDYLQYIYDCLLYTSDAADERSSVDLGGRRIIKKKTQDKL